MRPPLVVLLAVISVSAFVALEPAPVSAGACGTITTPWDVPPGDDDCDGIASAREDTMGTLRWVTCPATTASGDEDPDPWPPDADDDQDSDVGDVVILFAGKILNPPAYTPRSDFDGDGDIDIGDTIQMGAFILMNCTLGSPPYASTSRYMKTTDTSIVASEGCRAGEVPQTGAIILDFGQPWWDGSTYGTILLDNVTFASIAQIEEAAKAFLRGYWACSPPDPHITLVIGTNNCGDNPDQCISPYTGYGHGQAWAEMVNRVNGWIDSPPPYRFQEDAVAGSDMQLDWNSPTATRAWVDGYDSANNWPYYNYGSAEGCPTAPGPGVCGTPFHPEWTQDDVWYVSWGVSPAWPLPEIYRTDGALAAQWHALAVYSLDKTFGLMRFKGTLTQWQACHDKDGDVWCRDNGLDNRPSSGWRQLWILLNGDSRTAQNLDWSTDITQLN